MKKFIYTALSLSPMLALAQEGNLGGVERLVRQFGDILNSLVIPILFAIAIIYFFWGLVKYIKSAGDPKAAAEGRSIMIWGIIALVVMVSVYGLIAWVQSAFGIQGGATPTLPTVPGL